MFNNNENEGDTSERETETFDSVENDLKNDQDAASNSDKSNLDEDIPSISSLGKIKIIG